MTCIVAISVTAGHAPLSLLERLSFRLDELATQLPSLRRDAGAQVAVLSTCQRVELYAADATAVDERRLLRALATHRGVGLDELAAGARVFRDDRAVRHLFRVTAGLESFVLGEHEIAGQVRKATRASRESGASGGELNRLLESAVRASRSVHERTTFCRSRGSVATAAVDRIAASFGGDLVGRRVLVVGAGQVASVVVARAAALGARVTVANRTRQSAQRFAAAGAQVVDLAVLPAGRARADVVILATSAPQPLVDAASVPALRRGPGSPLLLVDLAMPRNIHPSVRAVPFVELVDLGDLRGWGTRAADRFTDGLVTAELTVNEHVTGFLGWLAARRAADAVRRMRAGADAAAQDEVRRVLRQLPPEHHDLVRQALTRLAHRLAHEPTMQLRAAAGRGDEATVDLLAGLFAADEPDATVPAARTAGPFRLAV